MICSNGGHKGWVEGMVGDFGQVLLYISTFLMKARDEVIFETLNEIEQKVSLRHGRVIDIFA